MTLLARIRAWLSPPDPLEPNAELVDSLLAEQAYRADKLRRELAVDQAMDRAHAAAVEDNRAYQKRNPTMPAPPLPTPYQRKATMRRVK